MSSGTVISANFHMCTQASTDLAEMARGASRCARTAFCVQLCHVPVSLSVAGRVQVHVHMCIKTCVCVYIYVYMFTYKYTTHAQSDTCTHRYRCPISACRRRKSRSCETRRHGHLQVSAVLSEVLKRNKRVPNSLGPPKRRVLTEVLV